MKICLLVLAVLALAASVHGQGCPTGLTSCTLPVTGVQVCVDIAKDQSHCGACNQVAHGVCRPSGVAGTPSIDEPFQFTAADILDRPTAGAATSVVGKIANAITSALAATAPVALTGATIGATGTNLFLGDTATAGAGNIADQTPWISFFDDKVAPDNQPASICNAGPHCIPTRDYTYTCRATFRTSATLPRLRVFLFQMERRTAGFVPNFAFLNDITKFDFQLYSEGSLSSYAKINGKSTTSTTLVKKKAYPALVATPMCGIMFVRDESNFANKKKRDLFAAESVEEATGVTFINVYTGTADCTQANEAPCKGRCIQPLTDATNCGFCRAVDGPENDPNYLKFYTYGTCLNGIARAPRMADKYTAAGVLITQRLGTAGTDTVARVESYLLPQDWAIGEALLNARPKGWLYLHNGPPLAAPYVFTCQWSFYIRDANAFGAATTYRYWIGFQNEDEPWNVQDSPVATLTANRIAHTLTRSIDVAAGQRPPKCYLVLDQSGMVAGSTVTTRITRVATGTTTKERTGSNLSIAFNFDQAIKILPPRVQ